MSRSILCGISVFGVNKSFLSLFLYFCVSLFLFFVLFWDICLCSHLCMEKYPFLRSNATLSLACVCVLGVVGEGGGGGGGGGDGECVFMCVFSAVCLCFCASVCL